MLMVAWKSIRWCNKCYVVALADDEARNSEEQDGILWFTSDCIAQSVSKTKQPLCADDELWSEGIQTKIGLAKSVSRKACS